MHACRGFSIVIVVLGLVLAARAGAQEGTWDVSGEVRYVAHYEGQSIQGALAFSLEATLDAAGGYTLTLPPCTAGDPPVIRSGHRTRASYRLLSAAVRDAIDARLTSCGSRGVRVRNLRAGQQVASDRQTIAGRLAANVRYRFTSGDELETVHARVKGRYRAVRRAG